MASRSTLLWIRAEAIPDPWFRHQVRLGPDLDLLAELADEDAQVLGLADTVNAPHRREQRTMGQHTSGMFRHVEQKLKLLGGEAHVRAPDGYAMGIRIDHEIADVDGTRGFCFGNGDAAKMGPHARLQLLHAERLGDVIVCACIERFDLAAVLIAYRQ